MQNVDMHRIFLNHSDKMSRSFFMCGPLFGVFLNRIHNMDEIRIPVERSGCPKFWTFKIKWVEVIIIYYIYVTLSIIEGWRRTCRRFTFHVLDVEAFLSCFFAMEGHLFWKTHGIITNDILLYSIQISPLRITFPVG